MSPQESPSGVVTHTSSEGDKYVDLGKKKRATVRSFKGNTFVDIREFYVSCNPPYIATINSYVRTG